MEKNKIYQGDCLEVLKTFPDESIDCCMTSLPYWRLRDNEVKGQLGLEKTSDEYIKKLCNIFDEIKRVLRKDGTCWINVGDVYSKIKGMEKSLCNIPARFSIEMQNRGWILRNVIIWYKPNCMPSSVKDRFTVDFEYLFFFVKNKKYFFKTQYEPHNPKYAYDWNKKTERKGVNYSLKTKDRKTEGRTRSEFYGKKGRIKRTVWKICSKPFKEAHFSVFPEELCEIPLKAGCKENGIILDNFCGAGTTGLVAFKQNKNFIGIELNPKYVKIAKKRLGIKDGKNK